MKCVKCGVPAVRITDLPGIRGRIMLCEMHYRQLVAEVKRGVGAWLQDGKASF